MATNTLDRPSGGGTATNMRKYLDDFLVFLAVEKGSSANTVAAYKNDLQQLADFIGKRPGAKGWEALDRSLVQDFILHMKNESRYNESTDARKVAAMRSFYAFLSADS